MRRWGCALFGSCSLSSGVRSNCQSLGWFSRWRTASAQRMIQQPRNLTSSNPAAFDFLRTTRKMQSLLAQKCSQNLRPLTTPATVAVVNKMFAVVEVGGKQYKVCENDRITTEKVLHKRVGEKLVVDKVLLIGTPSETKLGQPLLAGAYVEAVVEQQTLSEKVYIFKKRRRKNSRRLRGYRASVTSLRIVSIHEAKTSG